MRQISTIAAEPPLGEHRRDVGREHARALARRIHDHAGEARPGLLERTRGLLRRVYERTPFLS